MTVPVLDTSYEWSLITHVLALPFPPRHLQVSTSCIHLPGTVFSRWGRGGGRVTCYGCYCWLSWWLGERSWGDVLTVSSNADTGESPTVRRGIVLLALVTPGRRGDFLENVARTVWRRRGVGSRPARKLQEKGHGCVRGAVSPSGPRTEAQDGNWKCGWTQAKGSGLHGGTRTAEGPGGVSPGKESHIPLEATGC